MVQEGMFVIQDNAAEYILRHGGAVTLGMRLEPALGG